MQVEREREIIVEWGKVLRIENCSTLATTGTWMRRESVTTTMWADNWLKIKMTHLIVLFKLSSLLPPLQPPFLISILPLRSQCAYPWEGFLFEFVVSPAVATPVEEIICASRRVITEAEGESTATKLCLWPQEQPETSSLLLPPLHTLPLFHSNTHITCRLCKY